MKRLWSDCGEAPSCLYAEIALPKCRSAAGREATVERQTIADYNVTIPSAMSTRVYYALDSTTRQTTCSRLQAPDYTRQTKSTRIKQTTIRQTMPDYNVTKASGSVYYERASTASGSTRKNGTRARSPESQRERERASGQAQ